MTAEAISILPNILHNYFRSWYSNTTPGPSGGSILRSKFISVLELQYYYTESVSDWRSTGLRLVVLNVTVYFPICVLQLLNFVANILYNKTDKSLYNGWSVNYKMAQRNFISLDILQFLRSPLDLVHPEKKSPLLGSQTNKCRTFIREKDLQKHITILKW